MTLRKSFHDLIQLIRLQWNAPTRPSVRLAAVVLTLAYFAQETHFLGRETGIFIFSFLVLLALQTQGIGLEQIHTLTTWLKARWHVVLSLLCLYTVSFVALLLPALNVSVSGDEGWHIQKANPLLAKIQELAEHGYSLDYALLSHLDVFDWHVASVWNFLRLPTFVSGLALLALLFRPIRFGRLIQLLLALSVFSIWMQSLVDPHAPLRIYPTLAAQTVFGLSDFSNRMGGPIFAALFCSLSVATLLSYFPKADSFLKLALVALPVVPLSNPQIFFTIPLIESSSFGVWFWIAILVLCGLDTYESTNRRLTPVLWAFAIGVLFRQGLIALIPLLALCYWPRRKAIKWNELLPLVTLLPYLVHVTTQPSAALKGSVADSFWSFFKWDWLPDVAQNFGFPHLMGLLIPIFLAGRYHQLRSASLQIFAGSLLSLFFYFLLAKEYLFPAGRYQAEYIGGSFAGLLILQAILLISTWSLASSNSRARMKLVMTGAFVGIILISGVVMNLRTAWNFPSVSSRTGNSTYLVTAPSFPYEEAIDAIGDNLQFVVAGGSPYITQARVWNHMASFKTALTWTRLNWNWRSVFEAGASSEELKEWLIMNRVEYVLRLSDSPREVHHRTPRVQDSMKSIDQLVQDGLLYLTQTSRIDRGDQIEVYRLRLP